MQHLLRFVNILGLLLVVTWVSADAPVEGRAGRAEVRFLQGMIDHHQMAVDMAQHCLAKARTQAVKTICDNVIAAQTAEIALMVGWLRDWYNIAYAPVSMLAALTDVPAPSNGHAGHAGHGTAQPLTDPAMTMGMFAGLGRAQGLDYDMVWLENMIDHHDDALHMAARVLQRAEHADLRALAEAIIADQTAEIDLMEALLTRLR